jgi:DeoR family suf operon transcriptional repressor
MRIVKLLVGNPPQTVATLIKAAGVTRTAVAEQLHELLAAGFVKRRIERLSGRGRPHHLYSATETSLRLLFSNNQRRLVPAIWQTIEELGGDKLTRKVLGRVAQLLAEHYRQRIAAKKPEDRLRELIHLLCEEGGLVEAVRNNGQLVMRKRSCPFISMLDEKRFVCCVDLEMISDIVGQPVRRTTCRHDGDPCCTFEISAGKEA